VFQRFYADARSGNAVRVVGDEKVRWPLVHGEDLAVLYRLVLENGVPGESYLGVTVEGMEVGQIARAFAQRFSPAATGPEILPLDAAVAEYGIWAAGYALDQVQSGDKARRCLGWNPVHTEPLREIANLDGEAGAHPGG
jgi:nucleoside-diphosphate-sugar epimerase